MGLFKDVRKLSAQAKELQKDYDPGAQMRAARTQMQAMTAQSTLATSSTAVRSPATVVALRDTGTLVNYQPVFDCDVMVMPPGAPPFQTTLQAMGAAMAATLQPGASITVLHEPGDVSKIALA